MDLTQVMTRIKKITKVDMQYKSIEGLYLSVAEEYGELATELKVENEVFCNAHKQINEGSAGESVDLFITAAAMMYALEPDGRIDIDNVDSKPDPNGTALSMFYCMGTCFDGMGLEEAAILCIGAIDIYFRSPNTTEETFLAYVNKKLDKWEANQTRELTDK